MIISDVTLICLCVSLGCTSLQNQSQLIWGIKDKLRKYCSANDMKELLIANGQEVPSGETNVREACFILCLMYHIGKEMILYLLLMNTVKAKIF